MEYNIRAYVDELFQSAPKTQKAFELKVELTQNLIDKYYALVNEGKSEQDAYNLTVMSIGDVRELFTGLEDDTPVSSQVYIQDDDSTKRRAAVTAIAIMIYIASIIPLIISSYIGGDAAELFGVVFMFTAIAVATGMLIYNFMTRPKGRKAQAGTVVGDFKQWQQKVDTRKQFMRAMRPAYSSLIVIIYFLVSFATQKWYITWIIFLIAPLIEGIVKAIFTLVNPDTNSK